MYAQCPNCLTFFHLKPAHLKAANGRVRCSRCKHVFNALETLRDELAPEEIAAVEAARKQEPKPDAPLLNEEYVADLFDGLEYTRNEELGLDAAVQPVAASETRTVAAKTNPLNDMHDFAPPRSHQRPVLLGFGSVVLALLLALQIVHWQRFEILEHSPAGAWLARAYAAIGVDLQPPRDLAALDVSRTAVRSHPEHPQALYLTALLQNSSGVSQPWPALHVVLQDRWGETVAARYFAANEYLRDPNVAAEPLAAHARHTIRLAVLDPGSKAVGFQVEPCFALRSQGNTRYTCLADVISRN